VNNRPIRTQFLAFLSVFAIVLVLVLLPKPPKAEAIPAFSRMYSTSCATCHVDFPKLNDFGKAFKDAGFKFPKDDESMIKIPPVMLGAPAQAELWPKAIWPGKIPGLPPVGLRYNTFFQYTSKNANNFQFVPTGSTPSVPNLTPRTDFEPGLFSIFMAGNFGSDIAFWVDDDISVAGANSNGGLGDGYLKFVNVGRFAHLPKDAMNLRVGQFELDLPFSPARSWNVSGWDIFSQTNLGSFNPSTNQQNVNNNFSMDSPGQGVEISGGHHYGGYWYSLAVIDQNTSGAAPNSDVVPSATGFISDSNFKDLYGHFEYRWNLEKDKESRTAVQAAGEMGPRDHTYLSAGTLYLYGRSVNRLVGVQAADPTTNVLLTAREPFYRVGADFSFNYHKWNLFGVYMYGRDHNLVPVDASGNPSPENAIGFVRGRPAIFRGGFLESDYMAFPWMMLIMRYDAVNSSADYYNGLISAEGTPYFGPADVTRNRFTPGVQFLIHANIKASFEYQIRPRQEVSAGVNPLTGTPALVSPFRTNTATAALEFVY
jgi:hypothetical protein